MGAGIIKQRLIGSVLLLLIMMVPVVFLTHGPSYDNETADKDDSDYQYESAPSVFVETKTLKDDLAFDSKHVTDDGADKKISIQHKQKQTVISHHKKSTEHKQNQITKPQYQAAKPAKSWIIQLGSFKVESNARKLHEKITKMGTFNVSIKKIGDYYVVYIVIEADKQDVDKRAALLAKKLKLKLKIFLN